MDVLELKNLLEETKLSAEELGKIIGISGMTVRRWCENSGHEGLAQIYKNAIRDAVFKLIIDGRLNWDSTLAQQAFSERGSLAERAAIKALGFPDNVDGELGDQQDKVIIALSHIGSSEGRRQKVDEERKSLIRYERKGQEWRERISVLIDIISAKNFTAFDKFPAYGALFYLVMPFDFVPDTIPVFGSLDDFAVLGIAASYYIKRMPSIENAGTEKGRGTCGIK
jgi:uncharacterized membrane protein YkvA (DUF1232 family)